MYASRQTPGTENTGYDPRSNRPSPVQSASHVGSRQRSLSYTGGVAASPQVHRSQPASPTSSRAPPPSNSRPTTGYYDPMRDTGDRDAGHDRIHPPRSPTQVSPRSDCRDDVGQRLMQDSQSRAVLDSGASSVYQNGHQEYPRPVLSRHTSQSSPQHPSHAHPISGTSSNGVKPPRVHVPGSHMNGTGTHVLGQDTPTPAVRERSPDQMTCANAPCSRQSDLRIQCR